MTVCKGGMMQFKLSIRELFYACLCLVLGYLLRVRDSYSLNPVWRKRSELSKFANGKFVTNEDRGPSPMITDLEGDGVNEIVLISNDLQHLNVLAMPSENEEGDRTLAHVVVKHKVELDLGAEVRHDNDRLLSRPYEMGIGFTEPYQSMIQIRKQIIVVVTTDWQVLCYNYELKLLWKKKLPLPPVDLEILEVKSLRVMVSPFSIEKNHQGLIIVAGNFKHKSHEPDLFAQLKERESKQHDNRTINSIGEIDNETLTHFSTFALSADDGALLWKHASGDFEDLKPRNKTSRHADVHWKLGLHHNRAHTGESPWSDFGAQLDSFLPHIWADNSDTEIHMARVSKQFSGGPRQIGKETPETKITPPASALSPEHFIGFSYGGHRPHSPHEHVQNPNSLVLRSPYGIQVLSLVTGEPKASLQFPPDRSVYLDLDRDGHVEKLVWDQGPNFTPCYLDVWRLNPLQEKLDQISLCSSKRLFWTRSWSLEEDVYKKIPPRLIKSVARKSGILRHFLGHNLFEDNTYDIITFGGLGRVSSYGMDGTVHWQSLTESKWGDLSMNLRTARGRNLPDDIKEEFLLSFQPSRVIMPIEEAGPAIAVAVAGWNTLTIVDLVEGSILSQHSIPSPSAGPLVYGDFDNDGLVDIILTCKKGYIGFSLKLQHNYEYTVLYTIIVFLVIILFSWLLSISASSDNESDKDDVEDDIDEDYDDEAMVIGGDDMISNLPGS